MAAPTTTDELLTNIRKSGLITAAQLESTLADAPLEETPSEYLSRLVKNNHITQYQSEKLAVGKYKGFVLGPYVILDRIGGGGMGHVFLAEHSAMRRNVALKVLTVVSANDQVARERFFREARVAAGLNHPNVIRVFDLRREDAILYLVMEYITGDSIQHVVSRNGPLSWQVAVDYARQIALGLQHAHENGLVHRDIKPGNLLLSPDGTVKIIDLGLVRWEADEEGKLTEQVDRSILGTADYLAPEQAVNSSAVDIRADIYSLGATLYFMLAGRTMFPEGKTAQKLMWQQLKMPTPIEQLVPDLPPGLTAIISKCLAKKAADRYATPNDLAEALLACSAGSVPPPDPSWFPEKQRGGPSLLSDSRSRPRRPGLESTMMLPQGASVAKSSHLFNLPASTSHVPTMSDRGSETPRRWPLPDARVPLVAPLEVVHDSKPVSPVIWVIMGVLLTLIAVGLVLLTKPF